MSKAATLKAYLFLFMEIWKDINGYEGLYQVSDLGRIKSLGNNLNRKEKILKQTISGSKKYLNVTLCKKCKCGTFRVHQLVAIAFLNHRPNRFEIVVNHIDTNKINNKLSNIELVSHRENTNRKHCKSSSIYTGVHWSKSKNKWQSSIYINGATKYLGVFETEIDASNAYQKALAGIL